MYSGKGEKKGLDSRDFRINLKKIAENGYPLEMTLEGRTSEVDSGRWDYSSNKSARRLY